MILHTEILGEGEPIVFLHTGLQTGTTDFEYQRDYFKEKYKVILPDLRGHGKSVSNDFSNYFEDSAKDLAETLEALGIHSAHIVGCSLGALVGLYFAKQFPSFVKSLSLSGIIPEKPKNWSVLQKEEAERQAHLLLNEEVVQYFDDLHQSDWRKFLDLTNKDGYPFEETKNLTDVDCPVLYLVGEGNPLETKGAVLYPKMKSDVHVAIIPFAAHLVHTEQPEIYSQILKRFIEEI